MSTVVLKSNKAVNDKIYHEGYAYTKDGSSSDEMKIYFACEQ